MQGFIAAPGFEREITTTRARVDSHRRKTTSRPCFILFDRNAPQRTSARAETSQCCFTIERRNLFRQCQDATRKLNVIRPIRFRAQQADETRTTANESYEAGVAVRS